MSDAPTRADVTAAIEACDAIRDHRWHYWDGPDFHRVAVYLTEDTHNTAALKALCQRFDLRIWTVDLQLRQVVLVPAATFAWEYGDSERFVEVVGE